MDGMIGRCVEDAQFLRLTVILLLSEGIRVALCQSPRTIVRQKLLICYRT